MKTSHTCSVPGCGRALPIHILMCRPHWSKVPYAHRAQVMHAWRGYQGGTVALDELRQVQARATATVSPPAPQPPASAQPAELAYRGRRVQLHPRSGGIEALVTAGGVPLPLGPSRKLRDHSPTGFEWGYGGSGPAQLALALVLDATGDPELALRTYQWFKWAVVAGWGESWAITAAEVREWVARCEREQPDPADVPLIVEGGAA